MRLLLLLLPPLLVVSCAAGTGGAAALSEQVLKIALFDGFLRLAVRHSLLHAVQQPAHYDTPTAVAGGGLGLSTDGGATSSGPASPTSAENGVDRQRKRGRRRSAEAAFPDMQHSYNRQRVAEIGGQLARLVAAMNTAPAAKAAAVAGVLRWVVSSVQPGRQACLPPPACRPPPSPLPSHGCCRCCC